MGKIEIGESLVVLVVPSPKPRDGPAEDHDLAHEWNQRAGAAEKQVHRPLWAFEEIGDGGGIVHGDAKCFSATAELEARSVSVIPSESPVLSEVERVEGPHGTATGYSTGYLDSRFAPLGMTAKQIDTYMF